MKPATTRSGGDGGARTSLGVSAASTRLGTAMSNEMSVQQREAFAYFDATAEEWRRKAEGKPAKVNIIAQRNRCVLRVSERLGSVRRFLDIGCGTGELVFDMAATGAEATGVDFAPDMIRACESKKRDLNVDKASFVCQSVFDFRMPKEPFDVVSALGFVEYISPDELDAVLEKCARMLRAGGALVVGSRNRLFNIFSLNDYTRLEQELGLTDRLLGEAIGLASAPDMTSAIRAARAAATRLPHPASHPGTGIGVRQRYQYTPGELAGRLEGHGLRAVNLFAIHYHAMPAAAKQRLLDVHVRISDLLYEIGAEDHRLIPYASSFVIDARRS